MPTSRDSAVAAVEAEWERVLAELELGDCTLLTNWKPRRRVYRGHGRIYKIELAWRPELIAHFRCESESWYGSLGREFQILTDCKGIPGIPLPLQYRSTPTYEFAVYDALDGRDLRDARLRFLHTCMVLWRLAWVLVRISWRGIAHNDLNRQNLLLLRAGGIGLIDFDNATRVARRIAYSRNFLPYLWGADKPANRSSWVKIADALLAPHLPGWIRGGIQTWVRAMRWTMSRLRGQKTA